MAANPSAVGETPLLEIALDIAPTVYAKAEWFNQVTADYGGGSIKTRIGKAMIDAAVAAPEPIGDRTLLEASSGNTGTAVARFGTERGFNVEIVLPDDAGAGKMAAIEDAGAETTFIDSERGYDAYVEDCREMVRENPGQYHYLDQYENAANPGIHAGTTGIEIWGQTDGAVTHFVAGAGTGGTLIGTAHALSDRGVDIYGFEPATDEHDIAGLKHMHSEGHYVPGVYEPGVIETMSFVPTDIGYKYVRWLHRRYESRTVTVVDPGQWDRQVVREHLRVGDDFLVGPSSGACLAMVARLAAMDVLDEDDVVVVPFPDRGDRYPDRDLRSTASAGELTTRPAPAVPSSRPPRS
ncbi:PLP-dependent cysteine synthase family protein [Halorubrum laminariae]|uniref:PLP-dependent cysteine synthase family protein n=1 Tax=Halorubrum laminariae TaxID=1433523 RepID=A0ABD6BWR5_9EURY|nr:pyridoxal-phosphate dependent enzyme [Halorubrum laminariae]